MRYGGRDAAQAWNHAFYWRSLRPVGTGGNPTGPLSEPARGLRKGCGRTAAQLGFCRREAGGLL